MGLKITRATDPITVNQIVMCLYAFPGVGKTTLAATAEDTLLLDFDGGVHRAGLRGDTVRIAKWGEIASLNAEDLAPYKTVAVDTAGRAIDMLAADIYDRDPKNRNGANLSIKAYGILKGEFTAFLSRLRLAGKDVVLLAHADEQKKGDETTERLDVQGGSKNEIYKQADAMGRITVRSDGKRVLNFNPSDTAFGKNPAQLPVLTIPEISQDPRFLGEVIRTIKAKLNELTEAQREAQAQQAAWLAEAQAAETAEGFDELAAKAHDATHKGIVWKAAQDKGFDYDKKAKRFIAKAEKVPA